MRRFVVVLGVVLAGCRESRPPAVPAADGAAPGEQGSWVVNGRRYRGVREVENPRPPGEPWAEPTLDPATPTRLAGFTRLNPEAPCVDAHAVPDAPQWAAMLAALAAEPAASGVFEVVALADGCARLVEYRAAGAVQRWEFRRFVGARWDAQITWDFDPGVTRPSTIDRFSLTEPLNRFGEWAKGEVHRKRFVARVFTHYRGEPALYAVEPGAPPRRVSSDTPTSSCRLDGSNHCDRPEEQRRWRFDGDANPY